MELFLSFNLNFSFIIELYLAVIDCPDFFATNNLN